MKSRNVRNKWASNLQREVIKTGKGGRGIITPENGETERREQMIANAVLTLLFLQKCFDVRACDWLQNVVATRIDSNTDLEC